MSQQTGTGRADQEPATTVIEWGAGSPTGPMSALWRDPRLAWVPAGLGAAAMFTTLVGEWQTYTIVEFESTLSQQPGLMALGSLGAGWVMGGMLMVTCLALTLTGQPVLRPTTRSIGLVLAGAQLAVLVALTVQLREPTAYRSVGLSLDLGPVEPSYGRALYLGYAAVALLGLALWLARPPRPAAGPASPPPAGTAPDASAGPAAGARDLTVGPAEPFAHPSGRDEWR